MEGTVITMCTSRLYNREAKQGRKRAVNDSGDVLWVASKRSVSQRWICGDASLSSASVSDLGGIWRQPP